MPKKGVLTASSLLPATMYILGARNRFTRAGAPIFRGYTKEDDKNLIKITARYFPNGYTIIRQRGFWNSSGTLISESGRTIIVVGGDEKEHQAWQNQIVPTFQQESILRITLGLGVFLTFPNLGRMSVPKTKAGRNLTKSVIRKRKTAGKN